MRNDFFPLGLAIIDFTNSNIWHYYANSRFWQVFVIHCCYTIHTATGQIDSMFVLHIFPGQKDVIEATVLYHPSVIKVDMTNEDWV